MGVIVSLTVFALCLVAIAILAIRAFVLRRRAWRKLEAAERVVNARRIAGLASVVKQPGPVVREYQRRVELETTTSSSSVSWDPTPSIVESTFFSTDSSSNDSSDTSGSCDSSFSGGDGGSSGGAGAGGDW